MARRQSFTPFCAAALKDETATFGTHALAESVRLGAATIVRLISSLHCDSPKVYVDKVRTFENNETNNRLLLCQGNEAENFNCYKRAFMIFYQQ